MTEQEYLNSRLSYDPETGDLRWKPVPVCGNRDASWNTKHAGNLVGHRTKLGYRCFDLDYKCRYAHQVIWVMMTGTYPDEVDHIDLDASNDRWANLRGASFSENKSNRRKYRNNTSGFKGVSLNNGKWRALIRKDNKRVHLGYFPTPELAHAAYCRASQELHGEFGRVA